MRAGVHRKQLPPLPRWLHDRTVDALAFRQQENDERLDPCSLPGITLWTSADAQVITFAGTTGMDAGYAAFDIVLPPGHLIDYLGTPLHAQWLWFDLTKFSNHGSTAGQRFRLQ